MHHGYRNKTRKRHRKDLRSRGLGSVEKYLTDYKVSDKVDIVTDPSQHKRGMPHRKYHGRTGEVVGIRGRCYEVEIKVGSQKRILIIGKEHLRLNACSPNQEQ